MQIEIPTASPVVEHTAVDGSTFRAIRETGQPAVLRGLAADWPAVRAARHSDEDLVEYMLRFRTDRLVAAIVGPPEIEGRFLYNDDLRALNFRTGSSPLDEVLDWLLRQRSNPRPYATAVQSEEIPNLLPGFEKENSIDLLDLPVVPRAWIGNRIRVAPHYDLMENIGIVVAGRRRFTLFPPEQLKNLYVGPLELTPAGTQVSLVDPLNPDLEQFPKFVEAMQVAQTCELESGDAIYIPYHWWHGVDSLEPFNLFVNYWWNEHQPNAGNPYDALLFAFYAIKTLSPDQRAVWKTVFEHYIFESNGPPAEHLPQHARGILGELTPDLLNAIRATLRRLLERL
jgi:hypothetical protein